MSHLGSPFGTNELDGQVWVASFIFTRCVATCPLQMAALSRLQKRIDGKPEMSGVRFVAFTVDPEHDTPAVLTEFARESSAESDRWMLLTGSRKMLWGLCRNGFKLPVSVDENDPASPVTHSADLVLVDRARRIRGYYDALNEKALQRLEQDMGVVLDDPPGPLTERKSAAGVFVDVAPDGRTNPGGASLGIPGSPRRGSTRLYVPPEIETPASLGDRARDERRRASSSRVRRDFRFTDQYPESGISFSYKAVEDLTRELKAVHYDHGSGVAVADVDGDGLLDIYFVNQVGPNQLARNLGGGRFRDVTRDAGVGVGDRIGVAASFADVDNDGDPDLYVTTVRDGNLLFENVGGGKFRDVSSSSGLDYRGHSSGAVFFDFDRDGRLDLFLANVGVYTSDVRGPGGYWVGLKGAFAGHLLGERTEISRLYRNLGGLRFEDVTSETGLREPGWSGDATPADLNRDGWTDLYVLSMQGHDEYWQNQEGRRFVRRSRELFPATPWGAMGVKAFDYDNDGRLDLFVTDMHTDMIDDVLGVRRFWYAEKLKMTDNYPRRFLHTDGNHVAGNALFQGNEDGSFREVSDAAGVETYWPWGPSAGDLNADGFDDLFIASSMSYPYRYGVNSVLLNDRGRSFVEAAFLLGVEPRRGGRTAKLWFTLDCGGADRRADPCAGQAGTLEVWGALASRSSVILDLDEDGDLDIVTNDFNSEPMVLVSDLAQHAPGIRYLKVHLVGSRSNHDGLGARVSVTAGGRTYTKLYDGQSGYLSHSLYPLYFGLDGAEKVDEVTVFWPSGATQALHGPMETNHLLTITER